MTWLIQLHSAQLLNSCLKWLALIAAILITSAGVNSGKTRTTTSYGWVQLNLMFELDMLTSEVKVSHPSGDFLCCANGTGLFSPLIPAGRPPPLRLCLFWWCSIADSLGVGWRVHTSFSAAFHKFSRDLSLPVQNNAIPGLFASFVHFHYRCFAAFGCRCYDRAAVVSVVLTLSSSSSTAVVILNYHSTLGRASFWISSPGFRAMFGLPVCRFIHFQS